MQRKSVPEQAIVTKAHNTARGSVPRSPDAPSLPFIGEALATKEGNSDEGMMEQNKKYSDSGEERKRLLGNEFQWREFCKLF